MSWQSRRTRVSLLLLSVAMAFLLESCAGTAGTNGASTTGLQGKIVTVGSTALQPLVTAAASLFQKQEPQVQIIVKGGGSITGLNAVNSHQADIGDSDLYADPAVYSDPNLTDHLVCAVPFTVVVGQGISLSSLSRQQIIDIFSTGKISNWQEVGGPDLPIVPIIRPATSGTRATFRKYVLGGLAENGSLLPTDSSQSVRDKVASTPGAIGYLALSAVDSSVRPINIDGLTANAQNIESGQYTFWSYEHMYSQGTSNAVVTSFLNFMMTPAIQRLAEQMHYIPIGSIKLPSLKARSTESVMEFLPAVLPDAHRPLLVRGVGESGSDTKRGRTAQTHVSY